MDEQQLVGMEVDTDGPTKTKEQQRVAMDGQRATLQTFAKAGNTAKEAYDLLCKAYGSGAMSKRNAYKRFKEFKDGRVDFRGQRGQHSTPRGKPRQRTDENIATIRRLVEEDARMTYEALSYESGLGVNAIKAIIKEDLGLTKKCARWVPRLLNDDHKRAHLQMAQDWLERCTDPDFKDKVSHFS